MKKNLLLSLALATLCVAGGQAQTSASDIADKKQTLFNSSAHVGTPYRIPAIATLSDGTVLTIADQRPCGADVGNGEVDIYAKVGTINADGSYTWSPASTDPSVDGTGFKIADGTSACGYGDAAVAADPNSGKVLVLSVGGSSVFGKTTSSADTYYVMRHYSEDNGKTWTMSNITPQFKGANSLLSSKEVGSMFFAAGRLCQSRVKEGRIYAALLTSENAESSWFSWSDDNYNYVFYTDDFGETWSMLGTNYAIDGADEAKVEELPNGDIVISSRTTGGRYYNVFNFTDIENAEGSWNSSKGSYTFKENAKACNGELMLYPNVYKVGETTGQTYNIMLQSLPVGEEKTRSNVSVYYKAFTTDKSSWAVSDFTSGWAKGIEVDDGTSAYSTMTILTNGEIGFLYEDDYYSSNSDDTYKQGYASGGTANIVFVPLTVEEITGGAYTTTAPSTEPVDPEFSLSQAAVTLTEGETTQLTLTTNSDGAVTYTSNNTAVATVSTNGVVTAVAAGTATITATVAATETYNAASATCTITVKAKESTGGDDDEEPETPATYTVTPVAGTIDGTTYYIASFSAAEATTLPSSVKAYYVKSTSSDVVTLTRITSGMTIPKNEGVLLMASSADAFTVTTTTDESNVATLTGNCLVAAVNGEIPSGAYVLAVKGSGDYKGQFAFCLTSSALTLSSNRAYLTVSSAAPQFRMRVEGETTGIDNAQLTIDNAPLIYDLLGRRVTEMQPGRIYIVNGKKVMND